LLSLYRERSFLTDYDLHSMPLIRLDSAQPLLDEQVHLKILV